MRMPSVSSTKPTRGPPTRRVRGPSPRSKNETVLEVATGELRKKKGLSPPAWVSTQSAGRRAPPRLKSGAVNTR